MKTLIILRHGQDDGIHLTEDGRQKVQRLAQELEARTLGQSRCILSSPLPRALETADVLADTLRCKIYEEAALSSAGRKREDLPAPLAAIGNAAAYDMVIVVTHVEYTEWLPHAAGHTFLGIDAFPEQGLKKGCAWYIDLERKTCDLVDA